MRGSSFTIWLPFILWIWLKLFSNNVNELAGKPDYILVENNYRMFINRLILTNFWISGEGYSWFTQVPGKQPMVVSRMEKELV